jgi:peptidoglycan/xylan/chitin deacetylase (PgdA/CDA1 family)
MPLTEHGFPVTITFDVDAETLWTGMRPQMADLPVTLSAGRYGPKTAMPRILALLERYAIPATFFVPGLTVERYPAMIEAILAGGHEVAHHSHSHPWLPDLDAAREREEMEKASEAIRKATGRPPAGYRAPGGEFGGATWELIREQGFAYSSNFFDAETPYLHEGTEIVELPWYWSLDDAPYFMFGGTSFRRTLQPPGPVLEAWKADFDLLYAEDSAFMLVMHPQIIGRPARMKMLESLLTHIARRSGVWFTRCDAMAEALRPRLSRKPPAL